MMRKKRAVTTLTKICFLTLLAIPHRAEWVEALANYYLINTNTSLSNKVKNDTAGKKNPGDNVYTTLDVKIQQVANDQLDIYRGAIIVTEVSTGKILAMVSHPDFDPNSIGEIWEDLVDNDSSTVLVNRATQGLYPPGSTFKIVTALEYIRENPNTYQNYSYTCNGAFRLGNSKISCYHGSSQNGLLQIHEAHKQPDISFFHHILPAKARRTSCLFLSLNCNK